MISENDARKDRKQDIFLHGLLINHVSDMVTRNMKIGNEKLVQFLFIDYLHFKYELPRV